MVTKKMNVSLIVKILRANKNKKIRLIAIMLKKLKGNRNKDSNINNRYSCMKTIREIWIKTIYFWNQTTNSISRNYKIKSSF